MSETIGDYLYHYQQQIARIYSSQEAKEICRSLFSSICGIAYDKLSIANHIPIDQTMIKRIDECVLELQKGKPLQYVLNEAYFYGHCFYVDKNVLIPRPETEEIISILVQKKYTNPLHILEIGTGSGCLAISIKKKWANWNVDACDISLEALTVARKNADTLQADIHFFEANILETILQQKVSKQYNVIVSNPPYIPLREKESLAPHVVNHEPHLALFVPNENPLLFIQHICHFAEHCLVAGGMLIIEIHAPLASQIDDFLKQQIQFYNIKIVNDFQQLPRFITAEKSCY